MRQIANPAGLRMLEAVIHVIDNKSEVKKILKEINDARDEANTKIAAVGKIEDINSLRKQAEESLQEAINTLDNAKSEADKILGKAGAKAIKEKERQKRADEILKAADAREEKLNAREKSIASRESELQEMMDRAAASHTEAMELKSKADELMVEANERLNRFKQFAASVQ